jgi:hypothetical protein
MWHRIEGSVEACLSRGAVGREEGGAALYRWQTAQARDLKFNCPIGAEHQYAVGNEQRLCNVVRYKQRRRPCNQLREFVVEAGARDGIKRRERFVEQ